MKKVICLFLALSFLFVMGACGNSEQPVGNPVEGENAAGEGGGEKVVTMGVTSPWMSLCHVMWPGMDAQQVFASPVFDTPVAVNGEGKLEGHLLSSWEATDETCTVYIGKINPDAYWQDGVKITANDFVFTLQTLLDPAFEGDFQEKYLKGTTDNGKCEDISELGIRAIDDETVEYTLKTGMAANTYFSNLRFCYIIPEHLLKGVAPADIATDPFWEHPVGSGPFKFDSYIDGERMEYVANENYYLGAPKFDRLVIKVVSPTAMLSSLIAGDVDMTAYSSQLSSNDLDMAKGYDNLSVVVEPGYSHDHILINNERFTKEQRVALNYIIDKTLIEQAAYGEYAQPAVAQFRQEHPFYSPKVEDLAYEYDPETGIAMLEEAGFDFDKTYTIKVGSSGRVNVCTVLKQMWEELNIKLEIEQGDMSTISSALFGGEYDFALMGTAGTNYNPTLESFYYMPGGWCHMTSMDMFNLCMQIDAALTFEEQYELCEQLQCLQVEESPMIILYHKMQTFVVNNRISNYDVTGFNTKDWSYWEWEVA